MMNERSFADHPLTTISRAYVYFIQAGEGGPIKIGKALNPKQRIGNIQVGNPHEVKLLHCFPDMGCDEGRMQGIFEESHLRGEWFNPTPDLLAFIDDLKTKTEGRARQLISRLIRERQAIRARGKTFSRPTLTQGDE